MSFLDFLGNAAGVAGEMAGQENAEQRKLEAQKQLEQQRFETQKALQQQQADLAEQKQRVLLELQQEMANKERTRVQTAIESKMPGLVSSSVQERMKDAKIADPSTWTPEMEAARNAGIEQMKKDAFTNPALRAQAALAAGEYGAAKAITDVAESGKKVLTPYASLVDTITGEEIAKNSGIEKTQAAVDIASARGAGKAKPLDPMKVAEIVEKIGSKATLPPNPFPTLGEDGKSVPDTAGRSAFEQLYTSRIQQVGDGGDYIGARKVAMAQYTQLHSKVVSAVQDDFKGAFDSKGNWNGGTKATDAVQTKYGFDPSGLSKTQVLARAREVALTSSATKLADMMDGDTGGDDGKPAAPAPKAETPKAETPKAETPPAKKEPAAPKAPTFEPPPDSYAGKAKIQREEAAKKKAEWDASMKQKAADTFASLAPTDRVAAGKLQASDLFDYLSQDQKQQVYKIVNGIKK